MPTLAELNAAQLFEQAVQNNTLPQLVDRALTGNDAPELKQALQQKLASDNRSREILSMHPKIFQSPLASIVSPLHPDIFKYPEIINRFNISQFTFVSQHPQVWNHPNILQKILKVQIIKEKFFRQRFRKEAIENLIQNPKIFEQEAVLNYLLSRTPENLRLLGKNTKIFDYPSILNLIMTNPEGRNGLRLNPSLKNHPDISNKIGDIFEKWSPINNVEPLNQTMTPTQIDELVASIKPIPEERPLPSIPLSSPTAEVDGNRPFTYQELLDITQLQAQKIFDLRQHRDNLYQENQHLRGTIDPSSYYNNNVAEMGSPPTPTFEHPELAGVSSLTGRGELNAAPVFPNSSNILEFPTVPTPVRHQEMDGVPVPRQGYTELPQQAFSRSPVQRPRKKPLFGGRLARFGI